MITVNKNIQLGRLVDIRSGVYRKSVPLGQVYQIQKGNFGATGDFLPLPKNPELAMEPGLEKHLLLGGEILVTAKGEANVAYHLPELARKAVASSVFLVLRKKKDYVSGPYLMWYLNTKPIQQMLSQFSRGSSVHSLAKRDLQQLSVPLPVMSVQQAIVNLDELQRTERKLYRQLIAEKQKLVENQLLQVASGTTNI